MSSNRVPLRIETSLGRLLVLLAALAGLFAMHGLSDHGMTGPDAVAMPQSMAQSMSMSMAPAVGSAAPTGAMAGSAEETPSQQPGHNGHEMGLAGLCLAVLAAALLVGWSRALRGQRRLDAWLSRRRADLPVPRWLAPLRPPDLNALSILRC